MKKTALIILNYNNYRDTRNCIESILRYNTAPVKFVVADNASRPDELESLKSALSSLFANDYAYIESGEKAPATLPYATLIETGGNLGYARGNNVALEAVFGDEEVDKVMILNNDILFVEDIIPKLAKKMQTLPDCAIISPVLLNKTMSDYDYTCARRNITTKQLIIDNLFIYLFRLINPKYSTSKNISLLSKTGTSGDDVLKIELPSGSCMLADKDMFKEIGAFDPNTFLYFEENILYRKIQKIGRQNYLSLSDKCVHLGAATTSNQKNSLWLTKEGKKSEVYYVSNYTDSNAFVKKLHKFSAWVYVKLYTLQKMLQGSN